MYNYQVIEEPAGSVLTLAECKQHLRVETDEDDSLIDGYLAAAVRVVEEYTNRCLLPRKIAQTFPCFPVDAKPVDCAQNPLIAVESLKYKDSASAEVTVTESEMQVVKSQTIARIWPPVRTCWPQTDGSQSAVTLTYTAGYPVGKIPSDILAAVRLILTELYERREDFVKRLPTAAEYLLRPHKIELLQWEH